jgi:hypothetical protein
MLREGEGEACIQLDLGSLLRDLLFAGGNVDGLRRERHRPRRNAPGRLPVIDNDRAVRGGRLGRARVMRLRVKALPSKQSFGLKLCAWRVRYWDCRVSRALQSFGLKLADPKTRFQPLRK